MKRIDLAQRRKTLGFSQERLAEQLGVDRTTVIRWERGETEPQPWQRPNLATALAVSLDELDTLLTARSPDSPRQIGAPLAMLSAGTNDAPDDLAAMQSFRMADRQMGGGHLYATVTGYLQHNVAPRQLGAHVLASLSHLSHCRRQPEQAVHLAQRGRQSLATGQPHPGVQSRLLAMEARGHAVLHQQEECTQQLLLAERTLEGVPGETSSPWVSHFDHAALAAEAARCFRDLGQLDSAKRYAEQVVALRQADRPRSRAFAQLMLVSVLIAQEKIDEACIVAREALVATRLVSSFPVLQQLGRLGGALSGHRRNPEVAVFLGLLQEELAQRRSLQWVPSS